LKSKPRERLAPPELSVPPVVASAFDAVDAHAREVLAQAAHGDVAAFAGVAVDQRDLRILLLVGRRLVQAHGHGQLIGPLKVKVLSIWSSWWPASTVKRLTSLTLVPAASQPS
jgi:hypothetical protein